MPRVHGEGWRLRHPRAHVPHSEVREPVHKLSSAQAGGPLRAYPLQEALLQSRIFYVKNLLMEWSGQIEMIMIHF